MRTVADALKNNLNGLYYGNRVILPFNAYILKVIVDDDILMDFSPESKHIFINETEQYLEIYFKDFPNLKDVVSKFESIKLIAVDKADDVFDTNNHHKLDLRLEEKHNVKIEKTDEDILFIE